MLGTSQVLGVRSVGGRSSTSGEQFGRNTITNLRRELAMQVRDPVCGMMIEQEDAKAESTYQGSFYYFCSEECKETFDKNPEQYVTNPEEAAAT